jgi:hypothetical protein
MPAQVESGSSEAIEPVVEKASPGGITILNAKREPVVVHTDDQRITRALLSESYDRPDRVRRWCGLSLKGWIAVLTVIGCALILLWVVFSED